jgi:S-DNA-T family DNA segregation ATPase FtsK/SpoIIIE
MPKKHNKKPGGAANRNNERPREREEKERLNPETKRSIWAVAFVGIALVLVLAHLHRAGPVGEWIFGVLLTLFGWGYAVLPASLFIVAGVFLFSKRQQLVGIALLGAALAILSVLGLIELLAEGRGGVLGLAFGSLRIPFGTSAAIVLTLGALVASVLITLNVPLKLRLPQFRKEEKEQEASKKEAPHEPPEEAFPEGTPSASEESRAGAVKKGTVGVLKAGGKEKGAAKPSKFENYVPPPLSLLKSSIEKPTTGDLRANANIIKRTLESFGIPVDMGEINIGPKVTRYTLKPAEGMKLSRIEALHKDLSLALAAHPIRIEAPIPGKSLVGVEVPNKAAALVRLGSLMSFPEFQASGPLGFALGRDVTGDPLFADIERMPHLLVAGATGSGKSILMHSLIVSLLYKNSPASLKLILIDPKRVELTMYSGLAHLALPVITQSKKAIAVFRWAISEMERRYELLSASGRRDIQSYNKKADEPLPYILVVVDELADLMTSYGREVEGSIIRLAQMARATGLHLVLSTQRPSVEVITGLIKANITSRIALQVASQVDSRTILDTGGAEKLLGGGDLLFVSAELSKPKRIQSAYLTEEEIASVADFIKKHNKGNIEGERIVIDEKMSPNGGSPAGGADMQAVNADEVLDGYMESEGGDDELYDEAVELVVSSKKASASLLQRRLKVGYARAARLLDLMEEKGIIGPGEGAKPREVYVDRVPEKR